MSKLISLADYRYRENLAVLHRLSKLVLSGEIKAIAICAKRRNNSEEITVLGDYRDDPSQGIGVAMKLCWRLTGLADELDLL